MRANSTRIARDAIGRAIITLIALILHPVQLPVQFRFQRKTRTTEKGAVRC